MRFEIKCLSLKSFSGVAQKFKFEDVPRDVGKLECCKENLDGMIAVIRHFGFHILFSCEDTTVESMNTTQKYLEALVDKVKTIEVVSFRSGQGFLNATDNQIYLFVKNLQKGVDCNQSCNNLCIDDSFTSIMKIADNSSYFVRINDLCCDPLSNPIDKHASCKSGGGVASKEEPTVKPLFEQIEGIRWFSTRPNLFSTGTLGPNKMSLYTKHLHARLMEVAEEMMTELVRMPNSGFFSLESLI